MSCETGDVEDEVVVEVVLEDVSSTFEAKAGELDDTDFDEDVEDDEDEDDDDGDDNEDEEDMDEDEDEDELLVDVEEDEEADDAELTVSFALPSGAVAASRFPVIAGAVAEDSD